MFAFLNQFFIFQTVDRK